MKYVWFEEYATSKKGAYKEYKSEWEVDRYMIRDKMFAMHGGDNKGKEIITLKLDPMFGLFPRRKTRIYGRGNCRQDLGFRLESDGHVPNVTSALKSGNSL